MLPDSKAFGLLKLLPFRQSHPSAGRASRELMMRS